MHEIKKCCSKSSFLTSMPGVTIGFFFRNIGLFFATFENVTNEMLYVLGKIVNVEKQNDEGFLEK